MTLRFGLIGCGFIGEYHMSAARSDGRVAVVAFADVRLDAARAFQERFGGDYATDDARRLIRDDTLDGVIIATYHDSHARLTRLAAQAGRHILVEKPMGRSVRECLSMSEAVAAAGVHLAVNYKFRVEPAVRRAWAAVPRPTVLHAQFAGPPMPADDVGAWVFDPVRGGGLVNATACHALDLLGWFARSKPIWCSATSAEIAAWHPGMPDALAGCVRFESGAIATVLISAAGESPYTTRWFLQAYAGEASVVLHDRFQEAVITPAEAAGESPSPPTILASLVDAILTGSEPVAGAEAGIAATLLATSLSRSARLRRPVTIAAAHAA